MAQSDGIDVVALPRGQGKTTSLIERMKADPDLIYVTFSEAAAHWAWYDAGADLSERHRYVTPRGLEERKFALGRNLNAEMPRTRVIVDEALRVLEVALGMEVAAVAFSLEETDAL